MEDVPPILDNLPRSVGAKLRHEVIGCIPGISRFDLLFRMVLLHENNYRGNEGLMLQHTGVYSQTG
ncbi:MAG: hypothetical protein KJ976_01585 [Proteobacteria bacterium]|nr:hypothetical protein [Pseudomonadota bacterium]